MQNKKTPSSVFHIPSSAQKGFSLIETLVATAIIVMAAVGPLALAGTSLGQANYIKDQIVATFLAQEGLEIMRNVRDSQGIAVIQTDVNNCSSGCTVSGVDTDPTTSIYVVNSCGAGPCQLLKYDPSNYLYQYGAGNESVFRRTITIDQVVGASNEYKVKSEVTWSRAGKPYTIRLTENLFDRTW